MRGKGVAIRFKPLDPPMAQLSALLVAPASPEEFGWVGSLL
jgi:hypothetical protein